jgi:hypothetical protein
MGRLQERRPGAAAVHLGQRGPPDAAERSALERQALLGDTVTEVKEYEGKAHLLPAQEGRQEVADYALEWAVSHARQ